MTSELQECTLGELVESGSADLKTGPFGTTLKASEYSDEGTPLISVGEIREGFLRVNEDTPRVSEEITQRLDKYLLLQGDIVFGRKGSTHRNAIIKKHEHGYFLGSDGIRLRITSDKLDASFVSYQLRSTKSQVWLKINSEGTTMPSLNQDILNRFPLLLHPIRSQRAIAHILGTLDDKIEVNQKMNQTLEEIAKAIFKSWFVDFDPVRAKAEGRPTGLPPEISDLFPDELVDSEIGEIPKGWECVPISSLSDVITRGTAPNYTDDETYPVINQKCIRNSEINFELCKFTKYKRNIEQKFLKPFDTLVNSMGVGTLGRVSLFVNYKKSIIVDGLITVVRGITESESLFLYQHLSSRETEIINLSTGSTGQTSLKAQDLGGIKVVRPSRALLDLFAETTRGMYIKKRTCAIQNSILSEIRDLLLPKLISGELRIPDAEKFLEEAGI